MRQKKTEKQPYALLAPDFFSELELMALHEFIIENQKGWKARLIKGLVTAEVLDPNLLSVKTRLGIDWLRAQNSTALRLSIKIYYQLLGKDD